MSWPPIWIAGLAYLGMQTGSTGSIATAIYSVPIPSGGAPTLIANVPDFLAAMVVEPDGQLLVAGWDDVAMNSGLRRIDPVTGGITTMPQLGQVVDAMVIDPVSGALYLSTRLPNGGTSSVQSLSPRTAAGSYTMLAPAPTGGWAVPSGLAIASPLTVYGAASGSGTPARWDLAPNPGGAPAVGNLAFSLTNSAGSAGQAAVWALGLAPTQLTVPQIGNIELWVAPLFLHLHVIAAGPNGNHFDLPIPNSASVSGFEFFAQSVVINGSAWQASSGLHVRVQ